MKLKIKFKHENTSFLKNIIIFNNTFSIVIRNDNRYDCMDIRFCYDGKCKDTNNELVNTIVGRMTKYIKKNSNGYTMVLLTDLEYSDVYIALLYNNERMAMCNYLCAASHLQYFLNLRSSHTIDIIRRKGYVNEVKD